MHLVLVFPVPGSNGNRTPLLDNGVVPAATISDGPGTSGLEGACKVTCSIFSTTSPTPPSIIGSAPLPDSTSKRNYGAKDCTGAVAAYSY